jgi:flagellar biosynthesis/type III secretory pathway chaperone
MNNGDRLELLITLTERLADCLAQELTLLGNRRIDGLAELQREKSRLIGAYETEVKQLRQNQDGLVGERKHAMMQAAERLKRLVAENERALRAAKTVNDRILQAIVDALERERGQPVGYGRRGRPPANAARRSGGIGAVALDERL